MPQSDSYAQKKARYSKMLTVYGRKPALEVLQDDSVSCHALHLADNNREGGIIAQLLAQAERRGVASTRTGPCSRRSSASHSGIRSRS